jgi:hypothetical protein
VPPPADVLRAARVRHAGTYNAKGVKGQVAVARMIGRSKAYPNRLTLSSQLALALTVTSRVHSLTVDAARAKNASLAAKPALIVVAS